jgi:transposase
MEEEPACLSTSAPAVLARVLPDATRLRLEACHVDDPTAQITLWGRSTPATGPGPLCTIPACRIHRHDERTLADLPWVAYRVRLQRRVRTWFGGNRRCGRRLVTAQLP